MINLYDNNIEIISYFIWDKLFIFKLYKNLRNLNIKFFISKIEAIINSYKMVNQ